MTTTSPHQSSRHKTQLGVYGEACAARYLTRDQGMVVLDRNWRCAQGEIDLVLRDGRVLVVCEVKTRSSERFGSTLEAVTEAKAARLRVLALRYCEEHDLRPSDLRIDLVGILLRGSTIARIDHARGI